MNYLKYNSEKSFIDLYKSVKIIYTLYETAQETLYYCYEDNKDYGHIFAIETILKSKFLTLISDFENYINK